jgi:molybdenum cofactor cytidylyltransferase
MYLTAILLAAGQSQRLGKNKLLLPYKKIKSSGIETIQPVILHSLYTLLYSDIKYIIIVLGFQGKKIQQEIQSNPIYKQGNTKCRIKFIINKYYRFGMASSIFTGITKIPVKTDAVLVCLADKPSIKTKTIMHIITRAKRSRKSIIIPVYRGREGHPVLFKKKYISQLHKLFSPLAKIVQDFGGRAIIDKKPTDVSRVNINDIGIIQDIDTWQDYYQQINTQKMEIKS